MVKKYSAELHPLINDGPIFHLHEVLVLSFKDKK